MFTLAAAEPSRGWGGPVALLIAAVVFVAFATLHDVWMRRGLPSPTEGDDTDGGDTSQVSSVSDTDDTDRDTSWWGRIAEVGGRRVRVDQEPRDEALDLDLEDEKPESLEEAVDRMDRQGVPYVEIVRRVMADYQVSESTAKRRIRDSREARSAV
ncbi:hypothetical protein A6A27_10375 [Micromonospora sp. CB01531]|nr:hypothetical protein A6A27_10375 [Micromonospora sp. CB01531]